MKALNLKYILPACVLGLGIFFYIQSDARPKTVEKTVSEVEGNAKITAKEGIVSERIEGTEKFVAAIVDKNKKEFSQDNGLFKANEFIKSNIQDYVKAHNGTLPSSEKLEEIAQLSAIFFHNIKIAQDRKAQGKDEFLPLTQLETSVLATELETKYRESFKLSFSSFYQDDDKINKLLKLY